MAVDDTARSRITLGVADAPAPGFNDAVTGPQLYETLVRVDCMDRVIAGLAIEWSSDNGRDWQFGIRRGATFSDGTPASARSVAAALATLPDFAGVAAMGEYDLRVMLAEPADVRLFARRSLAVRRTEVTATAAGTGGYAPLSDSPDRALHLVARGVPAGPGADAARAPVPDTIGVRAFGTDLRRAVDAGVDMLVTHDAAAIAYARSRSGYLIEPLTWSSTYVLAATGAVGGQADVPADAFPSGVVGAAARPAQPPFWWDGCGAGRGADDFSGAAPAGSTATQPRILFLRDDPVARAIAERITALARGRTPQWVASRLASRDAPTAVGVGRAELRAALEDGGALAIVTRVRRVEHGGCNPDSTAEYGSLLHRWSVTALIDIRDDLVYRPGIGRVTVDADGTLRFGDR
ncbi:MAG TPA: hypothetical protein VK933_08690 [Longimicrobiales bacterium]|nr:hypothetical protein [Longimicrobiales bacterium]